MMLGKKSFLILLCLLTASLLSTRALHAQLIEATRSLEGTQEGEGSLNVLSEPPGLEVQLDGQVIGKTPVFSIKVLAGAHVLRIRDFETEIQIAVGKKVSMSWFKGTFIQIPEKAEPSAETPREALPQPASPRADEDRDTRQDAKKDPYYWPLNPRGPIY
jgi:hypothetical protein